MKKFIAILLVIALLMAGGLFAYALAEVPDISTRAAPLVDLTGVIIAVVLVVFDFLLAWIAKVIIPPIQGWLETRTTEKQRGLLWDAICKLVEAAEQTIRGPGMGEKRLAYVEAGLQERGYKIDNDLIEAAVKQMNDRLAATVAPAFAMADLKEQNIKVTLEDNEQDGPAYEITPEQLAAATELLEKLAKERADAPFPAPACTKDWCDLDENGNPIPEPQEAPQSVNE